MAKRSGSRATQAMAEIAKLFYETDKNFTVRRAQIFLLIAEKPGQSVTDLAGRLNISLSTASRNVAVLGDGHRGTKGLGLVSTFPDPSNAKQKLSILTPDGFTLAKRIEATS